MPSSTGQPSSTRNFLDAALVSSTFKRGFEPGFDDELGHGQGDEPGGHHQDVGVVVLRDEGADGAVPGQAGADGRVVVEGHGHAVAGAAEGDAAVDLAFLDAFSQCVRKVGIIDARRSVRPIVHDGDPFPPQVSDQLLLILIASMI